MFSDLGWLTSIPFAFTVISGRWTMWPLGHMVGLHVKIMWGQRTIPKPCEIWGRYTGGRFVRVDRFMFMFSVWYGHKPGVVNCQKIHQVSQTKLTSAMFSRKLSPERPFRLLICLPGKARSIRKFSNSYNSMTVKLRYSIASVGFRKGNFPCRCFRHGKGKISFRNAFSELTVN